METIITPQTLAAFHAQLLEEEKSPATLDKYLRDARAFAAFAAGRGVSKELTLSYKQSLLSRGYAPRSVNSMLAGVNRLLTFLGREDCRVKAVKLQKQVFSSAEKELSKAEYRRLLSAAPPRLGLVMQTICATGIRVSELGFFTLEGVRRGEILVRCKGKTRSILLPGRLRKRLLAFARSAGILSGVLFRGKNGKALDRKAVWAGMKALCQRAGVDARKVFPHNLRKLFARSFYALEKDIAKLADVLGHSSIDTTHLHHDHRGRAPQAARPPGIGAVGTKKPT